MEPFGVNPFQSLQARAFLHNMKAVDLTRVAPEPEAIAKLPAQVARTHRVLPVAIVRHRNAEGLVVAIADPKNVQALAAVMDACGMKVQPVLALEEALSEALAVAYPGGG